MTFFKVWVLFRTVPYLKDDSSNKVERMATEKSQAASRLVYAAQHPPVAALVYVALKINGVSLAGRHMSVGCGAASPYSRWAASAMIGHGCSQLADLLQSKHRICSIFWRWMPCFGYEYEESAFKIRQSPNWFSDGLDARALVIEPIKSQK